MLLLSLLALWAFLLVALVGPPSAGDSVGCADVYYYTYLSLFICLKDKTGEIPLLSTKVLDFSKTSSDPYPSYFAKTPKNQAYSEAVGSRIHEAKALLSPLVHNNFNVYSRGLKKNKKPSSKTLKMSTWVPIPSRRKRLADPPYLMEGIDPTLPVQLYHRLGS